MRQFGGGGHQSAGTCQVAYEAADTTLAALIAAFNQESAAIMEEAA
jgi:nanoRNase/pAp phosphatase (c-di-AMP/oligoRNAs hydrolase)